MLRIERRGAGFAARAISPAYFVCAEGAVGAADAADVERLRQSFEDGGLDKVRSLIWKRPAPPDRCWFAGADWALCEEEAGDAGADRILAR